MKLTADQLRARFPNASAQFIAANSRPALAPRLRPSIAQPASPNEPLAADLRKKAGGGRAHVSIDRRSLNLLDKDNLYGSVKFLCDALRYAGLIADDDPESIELTVTQRRVGTRKETGTLVEVVTLPAKIV